MMWSQNPDGLGLSYYDHLGKIRYVKGIMRLDQAIKHIEKLQHREMIIHFRWCTHGVISQKMTHPFPIETKNHKNHGVSAEILMHNGVINGFGDNQISDTYEFTYSVYNKIKSYKLRKKLLESIDARFCIMTEKEIDFIGDGWTDYNGLIVSNLHWLSYPKKSTNVLELPETIDQLSDPFYSDDLSVGKSRYYDDGFDDEEWKRYVSYWDNKKFKQ